MKTKRVLVSCMVVSALAMPIWLTGCDREVSHTSSTTVKDDGTVKTKDKTVTVSQDGTVTKEETSKTNSPNP